MLFHDARIGASERKNNRYGSRRAMQTESFISCLYTALIYGGANCRSNSMHLMGTGPMAHSANIWTLMDWRRIAITQRVSVIPAYDERRDCLDQAWTRFLAACGLLPVLLPNVAEAALALCEGADIRGLVLTGGNDLAVLGGDAPERDAVEYELLDLAARRGLPVLGVCRGMQVIQQRYAIPLRRVEGHVAQRQVVRIDGETREVNSYHCFAAFDSRPPLEVWAVADDGVVKAVRHSAAPIMGIMWHPERFVPFSPADVALFRRVFGAA
jgi:gamma-glutamyl-gamma-aminobutyrate hydrolase PuuD